MIPDLDDTGRGLHAAILADPADDLPKLVFADYLDESGHSKLAAYLRAECRLRRLAEWDDGRVEAECETERLLARNQTWATDDRRALFGPDPANDYLDQTRARFVYNPSARELLGNPVLAGGMVRLVITSGARLGALAASPALAGAKELWFPGVDTPLDSPVDAATLARAAASPAFAGLKSLTYRDDFADADACFAALGRFAQLRRLAAPRRGLTPAGLAALTASPAARTLRRLRLTGVGMAPAESLRPLLDGPPWPHLAELDLDFPTRDDSTVLAELVESPNFPRLVSLAARGNSGDLFDALAQSQAVGRLRRLSLGFPVTNAQLTRLLDSAAINRVGRLILGKPIGVAAATRKRYESVFGIPLNLSRR